MDDHCGKPIQVAELMRVMSAWLDRRAVDRGGPGRLAGAAA
jgi:hypothetical protein